MNEMKHAAVEERRASGLSRRNFLKLSGGLAAGASLAAATPLPLFANSALTAQPAGIYQRLDDAHEFALPELPYAYDALEPHIDARTMEIHHSKHHAGYTRKLNAAIAGTALAELSIEEILGDLSAAPEEIRTAVRNNGGGFANHALFWQAMSPAASAPSDALAAAIDAAFGSFDAFQEEFSTAAATRFGSGWAWLVAGSDGLSVTSTPNQDTPLMEGRTPILGLDVWEHAYYLHYQNRRGDYIAAFWNVVNWGRVSEWYEATMAT